MSMKGRFINVRIRSDKGYVQGYIDIEKIEAFRESPYDCNVTLVYTESECFIVYIKVKELFEKIMQNE